MKFNSIFTVPFKEYSYEVLSNVVKMLYFGEVAIRVGMLSQFNKILQYLEIACPCCMPIECHHPPGEESDGEGWVEANDDPTTACKFVFFFIAFSKIHHRSHLKIVKLKFLIILFLLFQFKSDAWKQKDVPWMHNTGLFS